MSAPDLVPVSSTTLGHAEPRTSVVDAPASPGRPGKIQPWHLERLAIVYVRQSSQYQVIHNKESAEVQSKLLGHATQPLAYAPCECVLNALPTSIQPSRW